MSQLNLMRPGCRLRTMCPNQCPTPNTVEYSNIPQHYRNGGCGFLLYYNYIMKKRSVIKRPGTYCVYILRCADDTLYVGSTNELEKRLHSHNHLKSGAHYTKIRRPVALVWSKKCRTCAMARKREGELKRLSRKEKTMIISNQ